MDATAGRWERLAAFEGGTVSWLASAPAADGTQHVFAATPVGVFRSLDVGLTWSPLDPSSAVADVERDGRALAATTTGLYRTRNGGESWRIIELDWDDVAVQCLALSPDFAEDRVLLAGTEDHGLLRSDDAGRSWEQLPELASLMV